jgi:hypothetical protein
MGVGPNNASSTVSTIDVKTRTKHPNDNAVSPVTGDAYSSAAVPLGD